MSRSLRIATFNLENLDDKPGDPPFDQRCAILRPQLQRLDADVLCLQEVNAQRPVKREPRTLRALERLLRGTPYEGFALVGGGRDGFADKHNVVVASRWPVAAHRLIRHELVPPPLVRMVTALPPRGAPEPVTWDRPVLHAEIDLPAGRRLHVFNLHLRAPLAAPVPGQKKGALSWHSVAGWGEGFFIASMKRAGQALETRLAVEQLFDADPQALVVVAGDYNAEGRETPVRLIRGDPDDTGNGHLALRTLVPLERTVPEDRRYSVLHGGQAVMLDHLLVSRPLLGWFRSAEIHNEALGDEVLAHAVVAHSPESYHAPVVAAFEMPDGAPETTATP
ncbi:endonuclease/exonuclease/phosphatase family protein [Azospirillum sp. A39]|uniref:endonuclease/exonuclease/phosphatase family protein n=1 Tax=Azospirillum sp. A39 TaxID=3462279 RepID=UPI0040466B4F